jgi:hypothetical protein
MPHEGTYTAFSGPGDVTIGMDARKVSDHGVNSLKFNGLIS